MISEQCISICASSRSFGTRASPFARTALLQVILTSAGDEFFLPDDHTFFWPQLPEPKFWLTLPNAEHSCVTGLEEQKE